MPHLARHDTPVCIRGYQYCAADPSGSKPNHPLRTPHLILHPRLLFGQHFPLLLACQLSHGAMKRRWKACKQLLITQPLSC